MKSLKMDSGKELTRSNYPCMSVFQCPVFMDLFGGSDLHFSVIGGQRYVMCPVCRKNHPIDKNNQIIEGTNGTKQNSKNRRRVRY